MLNVTTVMGDRGSGRAITREEVTGTRLMSLAFGGLLVFRDALGSKLLFRLGGGYMKREGIQPVPATRRSAIVTTSDFLAAALTDNSA